MLVTYEYQRIPEIRHADETISSKETASEVGTYNSELTRLEQADYGLNSTDIDHLVELGRQKGYQKLIIEERNSIKFGGYCGTLRTPSGVDVEVLPKTIAHGCNNEEIGRKYLKKMVHAVHADGLKLGNASIDSKSGRLLDTYIQQFLKEVTTIVHKGLKKSYIRVQSVLPEVKGRLLMNKQARRLPHQLHLNHVEHSIYSLNRPENRLIAYCLDRVLKWNNIPEIKQLTRKLESAFLDIPRTTKVSLKADFKAWSNKRDIAYYQNVKPWVKFIIDYETPFALKGDFDGPSLMFKTDDLFENYVAMQLEEKHLVANFSLRCQANSKSLLISEDQQNLYYKMLPDYLIYQTMTDGTHKNLAILDAKWKLLEGKSFISDVDNNEKYSRISEHDLRQLYVYWHKYFEQGGDLILVYPKHLGFNDAETYFFTDFYNKAHPDMRLIIAPFDLENDLLILPDNYQPDWLDKSM